MSDKEHPRGDGADARDGKELAEHMLCCMLGVTCACSV